MQVWFNGRLLASPGEAVLSVGDRGVTVGEGVFETIKLLAGRPFAVSRHLDRLSESSRGLGLPVPDREVLLSAIEAVLAAERIELGRLRVTLTAGMGEGRQAVPSLIVTAESAPAASPSAALSTVPWVRNERGPLAGLKTTSYAENVVAMAHARRAGADEAVLANTRGDLCEGTRTNVFYVVDGEVRTPTAASGCLLGVTRALVVEWCEVREIDEPIGVLTTAEEIFVTSTGRDVQPVHRIDDRDLVAAGPVTRAVMATWAERCAQGLDP